jgi:hypothetical protein
MQVTGLAAGREYLRFFFDPVGTICRLYQRHGPVTALGRVKFKQPRDVLLFAIGPEFNLLLYSVSEVRGQIREMVDFPANGAD